MQSYRKRSRNVLFLGELVLALTIFAICAVVCVSLLWRAQRISEQSSALNQAVFLAQSALEAGRVAADVEELAEMLDGRAISEETVVVSDPEYQIIVRLMETRFPWKQVTVVVYEQPDFSGADENQYFVLEEIYSLQSIVYWEEAS